MHFSEQRKGAPYGTMATKVGKGAHKMAEDANEIAGNPAFWKSFVAALRYDNAMPWADTKAVYDVMLTMKTETAAGTVLAELLSRALPGTAMRYVTKGFPLSAKTPGQILFRADYLTYDTVGRMLYFVELRLPGQGIGWKRYDRYVSLLQAKREEPCFSPDDLCRLYQESAPCDFAAGQPRNRHYQLQWKELTAFWETLAKEARVGMELIYLFPEPFSLAERLAARGAEAAMKDLGTRFHGISLNALSQTFEDASPKTRVFLDIWRNTQNIPERSA